MEMFFNNILNFLIRNLPYYVRVIISVVSYMGALGFLYLSIRVKNDEKPLSIGWFVMVFVALFIGTIYLIL